MSQQQQPQEPRVDAVDVHMYGGGILLSAGFWQLGPAYGLIAAGLLLVWLGARSS